MKKKQNLGLDRGLDFLFADNNIEDEQEASGATLTVPISEVEPNKEQPRKFFDKDKLAELAQSISEHGLLQPLIVKKRADGGYTIISGERRWRASRMAGLIEVPVIIKDIDDATALQIALIENLQREDLNVVEEAQGYRNLMEEFGMTQEEVSKKVGKSRPVIANALRILALPDSVLSFVLSGKISSGHARAMLPLMDKFSEEKLIQIAKDVAEKDVTVRQLENMAKTAEPKKAEKPKEESPYRIYYDEIQTEVSKLWGRKVKITETGTGSGKIELEFYDQDDFNTLIEALKNR